MNNNSDNGLMEIRRLSDFVISFAHKHLCSEQELRDSLNYLIPHDRVNQVLTYIGVTEAIDDTQTVIKVIHQQLELLLGPVHIEKTLNKRKFNTNLIHQSLEKLDVDWYQLCQQAKTKKYGDHSPGNPDEKLEMIRYLLKQGHSIQHALVSINSSTVLTNGKP